MSPFDERLPEAVPLGIHVAEGLGQLDLGQVLEPQQVTAQTHRLFLGGRVEKVAFEDDETSLLALRDDRENSGLPQLEKQREKLGRVNALETAL